MEKEKRSTDGIVQEYKADVHKLIRFIPWLETKVGAKVASTYADDDLGKSSITFPVYDSTLLSFIKEIKSTKFLDKNYAYAYSRIRMKTSQDEKSAIQQARIQDMDLLSGILSKYAIKGMSKGSVWTEGVENGVFLEVLLKLRELIEFYEGPLN
ncbi:MAG: hypothetical protein PHS74_12155 [Lachnospiraceae bacterium]|nr:hypothetical protein [Lachnospiraceae bacterium]